MKVTRAFASEKAIELGLEPIQIDGIPEGFSFWHDSVMEYGDLYKAGSLVGYTPGHDIDKLGAAFHMPVVFKKTDTDEMKEIERKAAKERFIELYKKNISNINGK